MVDHGGDVPWSGVIGSRAAEPPRAWKRTGGCQTCISLGDLECLLRTRTMPSFTVDPFLIFGEVGNCPMLEDGLFDRAGARKLLHLTSPTFRAFFVT